MYQKPLPLRKKTPSSILAAFNSCITQPLNELNCSWVFIVFDFQNCSDCILDWLEIDIPVKIHAKDELRI